MRTFAIALCVGLLSKVSEAQQCTCDYSATKGYYQGLDCGDCDKAEAGCNGCADFVPVQGGLQCLRVSNKCTDDRPWHEKECYDKGECNTGSNTSLDLAIGKCICRDGLVGDFCERCPEDKVGWPNCATTKCGNNGLDCSGHGKCDDSAATVPCKNGQAYNPKTHDCKKKNRKGTRAELRDTYMVVAKSDYLSICGESTCSQKDGQTCHEFEQPPSPDNPESITILHKCCDAGTTMCRKSGDESGPLGDCCEPYETCCGGKCCGSTETCAQPVNVATVEWTNPLSGVKEDVTIYARNEWKLPDGSQPELPNECSSSSNFPAPAVVRTVFYPVLIMLGIIFSAVMVLATTGVSPISTGAPALVVFFFAGLLSFSQYYDAAILATLSACVALGAAHKGGDSLAYALVPQFIALASMSGGMGVGILFVAYNGLPLKSISLANAGIRSNSNPFGPPNMWAELTKCTEYFGYWTVDPKPWNSDAATWGYCTEGWLSFTMFGFGFIVMAQMLMIVSTGVQYMNGSAAKSM